MLLRPKYKNLNNNFASQKIGRLNFKYIKKLNLKYKNVSLKIIDLLQCIKPDLKKINYQHIYKIKI